MLKLPPSRPEWLSASDAAVILGVSPRRVRQLAAKNQLSSRNINGVLHLSRDELFARKNAKPLAQRPLSKRSLLLLKDQLALEQGESVSPLWKAASRDERRRARQRVRRVHEAAAPARLLRAWSANSEAAEEYWSNEQSLDELRLYASGFSHPSAKIASSGQLEIRVPAIPPGLSKRADEAHDIPVYAHLQVAGVQNVRRADVIFDLVMQAKSREDDAAERLLAAS